MSPVETINCKHVEPNGKACRRVAFRNLFYCYAHKHLYPDAETRTEYEERRKTLSEGDPDYEPQIMKAIPEDPEPRTDPAPEHEPRPLPPDWDAIQKEEGWWDQRMHCIILYIYKITKFLLLCDGVERGDQRIYC